ncbi:MAG: MBL fold metallo-hydrolase RNA specificity domain-containing protein [Mizugakiibacter sp.]|uniref:MBL fold metallo-hydrolase RNA specificity domain-containing protein n=1 Tax=Mizugakiibacter sp. TaxID=1972610 RepID=UPI0031C10517|nr:MBL fold metallo-hydrolase [Xanthomonadaceae bacterium]
MDITFLGAAREVTGSCFLVEAPGVRFLVDCGMVQGGREAPRCNRQPFAFDARAIDFVLMTHAHIDHSGLLPKPTRAGHTVGGLSAHADQRALLAWTAGFRRPPRRTFVVHGEAATANTFAARLFAERGWAATVPQPGQRVSWDDASRGEG